MRLLLVLVVACFTTAARAGNPGPCPSFTAGWSLSGPPPITGILLDTTTSQLEMIWNASFISVYWPVPLSVMQTFSQSKNWQQTFQYLVAPSYEAILLQETNNCPILQEIPVISCYLTTETSSDLATESVLLLITENGFCVDPSAGGFMWVN